MSCSVGRTRGLGSLVAVAGSYSSSLTPSLGTSIGHRCGPKNPKKKKKRCQLGLSSSGRQEGSFQWKLTPTASKLMLAISMRFSSSPGPFHRATLVSLAHSHWLPPKKAIQEWARQKLLFLMTSTQSHRASFLLHSMLLKQVPKYDPYSRKEELAFIFWREACQRISRYVLKPQHSTVLGVYWPTS